MISVIIATYNRSEDLKGVLDCLLKQELRDHLSYEILIIDNNSKDDTKKVVESFIPSFHGKLKYLFEPQQGKPYAVNQGLKEAQGEIIVLTDDDCMFEVDYLMNIHKVFEEHGPAVGFIGGKINPRWVNCTKPEWFDNLTPEWFKESFWGPLAVLDYGDQPYTIDHHQVHNEGKSIFYGANIAVRKELFLKYGGFNLEKSIAEDTDFQLRFLKEGEKGLYAPQVQVSHKVTAKRLSPGYYYRWYFTQGFYREIIKNYEKKFYHPLGIRFSLISETIRLFFQSIFEPSFTQKVNLRCKGLFNLGQMLHIIKKNLY